MQHSTRIYHYSQKVNILGVTVMRRDSNENTTLSMDIHPLYTITASEAQTVSLIWTINLNKTPEQYACASKTIKVTDEDYNET